MEDQDFIFTSLQPWDIPAGATVKEIASEISKKNRVLFINSPLDVITYLKKENKPENEIKRKTVKAKKYLLRQINPNLFVLDLPFTVLPVQFLPKGILFNFVNYINNRKIYTYVKKIIQNLNFKNYILFIDNDVYRSFYAKDILLPKKSVFYYRDNLQSRYWRKHAPILRPQLCRKSDVVLVNSDYFKDFLSPYNKNTHTVGQGVNLVQYDFNKSYPYPEDLHNIPKPIIGYTGFITSNRLDAELIYSIAQQRPDYSFVMVGNEDDFFKNHPLHTLKNVFFLGKRPYQEIASYIKAFDVCINPQKINEITNGNYPLKIDEYLALGKATVATKTSFMTLFKDTVWNCIGPEEYLSAIDQALTEPSKEEIQKRIKTAQSHSWENCVNKIYHYISIL